jgi:hypothetical protein
MRAQLNVPSSIRASAALSGDFRKTLETARPLLGELAEWAQQLSSTSPRRAIAPLYVAYHAVRIVIFRALLRPFSHTKSQPMPEDKDEWDAAKVHIRQAARTEIDAALSRVSSLTAVDYQVFWAPCRFPAHFRSCADLLYQDANGFG